MCASCARIARKQGFEAKSNGSGWALQLQQPPPGYYITVGSATTWEYLEINVHD